MILKKEFFKRPTLLVAEDLLGKFLVRRYRGKKIAGMVTEVEAYDGPRDKASHASRGMTTRNKVMFGPAGYFYVYLVYGNHWMLNVVTGDEGYPAAVLIRGVLVEADQRGYKRGSTRIFTDGPGKVTKFFKIDKKFNKKPAIPKTGLWFENRGVKIKKSQIKRTPRIGVQYAKEWVEKPYRFILTPN